MSIKSYELSDFFRQLSLLVKSKLPLPESLHNIANNSSKREFQKVVNDIASQVENGTKLSEALKEYPFYFSEYEIKMIEAGERSGSLPNPESCQVCVVLSPAGNVHFILHVYCSELFCRWRVQKHIR
jgi:type II secretory pathway component PulF